MRSSEKVYAPPFSREALGLAVGRIRRYDMEGSVDARETKRVTDLTNHTHRGMDRPRRRFLKRGFSW
jgi:hypothetical protein